MRYENQNRPDILFTPNEMPQKLEEEK